MALLRDEGEFERQFTLDFSLDITRYVYMTLEKKKKGIMALICL